MYRRGLLVVISGPAGSGKSTLAQSLLAAEPEMLRAITATTRPPRSGEVDGRDYLFLSLEMFKQRIAAGQFVEYTEFSGQFYGSLRDGIERQLSQDAVVILIVDVQGSAQIRRSYPNAIHIFVLPPTPADLGRRLCQRGTEREAEVARRLAIAQEEINRLPTYDYLVINDDLQAATRDLSAIIGMARRHHIRGEERETWLRGGYADWHATQQSFQASRAAST